MLNKRVVAAIAGAGSLAVAGIGVAVAADSAPADKMTVVGSKTEVVDPGESVELMSARMRTSSTEDLVLQVTAECALTTNVTTTGNDDQSAEGLVRVWVEVDGKPVKISSDDTDGKVVFCNHAYRRQTTLFDDEDATIATYDSSRQANGFNWVKLNVGNGIHTITVKGDLTTTATNTATAKAAIGSRTLVVQPTKAAHNETLG